MDTLIRLVKTLEETYNGDAWHGPTIKKVLSDIRSENAGWRIGNSHSIIEIVQHMTAWRSFVVHKLRGDKDFDISDETNFPKGNDWNKAIAEFDEIQGQLLKAIASFDKEKLSDLVPNRKYSFNKLLHGIVHHDLYHLGQITMIIRQF